jgi:hypothetical protein
MKNEQYLLAHPNWVQVLKEDPDDKEAVAAKEKCEYEIMGKKLISLRDLIIGNNIDEALAMARSIRDFKVKWKINSDTDGASFEKTQIRKLFPHYLKFMKSEVALNHPLKALDTYTINKNLFIGFSQTKMDKVYKSIRRKGAKKCLKYKKKINKYKYYNLFVLQYCQTFDNKVKLSTHFTTDLYSDLNVSLNLKHLNKSEQQLFITALQKDFKNSVWYHPKGQNIASFNGNGAYKYKRKETPVYKIHDYEVKVAYKVKEKVKNKEGVEETKEVTKFKKVKRQHRYKATEITASLYMNLNAKILLNNSSVPISFLDSKKEADYESFENRPKIGLRPHKSSVLGKVTLIKNQSDKVIKKVRTDLSFNWSKKFCNRNSHNGRRELFIENVIKCLRLEGPLHQFVNNWFMKETGLNAKDSMKYLQIEHSKK